MTFFILAEYVAFHIRDFTSTIAISTIIEFAIVVLTRNRMPLLHVELAGKPIITRTKLTYSTRL